MKKLLLSASVLASLLAAGCSSDDDAVIDEINDNVSTHYMTVNIVSTDDGTRANGDPADGNGSYEAGSNDENQVNSIRFYFFTENGVAVNVKASSGAGYQNYYDWPSDSISQSRETTVGNDEVESHLSAHIVLNTAAGDKLPRTMVAVINPTASLKAQAIGTLEQLRVISEDYAAPAVTQNGSFVMSNSVYGTDLVSGKPTKEACAAFIENSNICETVAAANANPVTIYVERNAAKVRVYAPTSYAGGAAVALTDKAGKNITIDGQQVYLKLNGWALAAETPVSNLVKKIDLSWITDWWYDGYNSHRSSWALNSAAALANNYTASYSGITTGFGDNYCKYTNENAASYNGKDLEDTKFIVGGTLCKDDGTALTLVRHTGTLMVDALDATDESENLVNLKTSILSYFQTTCTIYADNGSGRTMIDVDDIAIEPNSTVASEGSQNNCFVHAKLTEAAKAKTWYNAPEGGDVVTADDLNNLLKDKEKIGEAMVWKSGQTYYYASIIHKNVNTGTNPTYGVVRNHVYKVNITDIYGLGTPVYNPGDIIYPEKPNPDDHYIAAKIEILAWRIASYNYSLDW